MGPRFFTALLLTLGSSWPAVGQEVVAPKIQHAAAGCWEPGRHPELRARVEPIAMVARARVLFRTIRAAEPHAVTMKQDGEEFVAVLPKPTGAGSPVYYRIEVTDPNLAETLGDEISIPVTKCAAKAASRGKADVEILSPAGAGLVPPGFAEDHVLPEGAIREQHAGVFNIGQNKSLVAALAVGAAAFGIGHLNATEDLRPASQEHPEEPGVTLIDATPTSGSQATLAVIRVTVRVVANSSTFGNPRLELRQVEGGPVCARYTQTSFASLPAYVGQNLTVGPLTSTGACGSTFEAGHVLFRLTDFAGNDVGSVPSGVLPLRYSIVP